MKEEKSRIDRSYKQQLLQAYAEYMVGGTQQMEEFFLTYVENLMHCVLFFANSPRRKHLPAYFLSLVIFVGDVLSVVGHVLSISSFLVLIYYLLEFCMPLVIFHFCS